MTLSNVANNQCAAVELECEPRPFLKWTGGKTHLLPEILRRIPEQWREVWRRPEDTNRTFQFCGRYFEPFLGGGAVFFALRPLGALLSDANEELMECYRAVRDDCRGLLGELAKHRYEREHFYDVRASAPSTALGRAARTIYLNKTCFNGLYRLNSKGGFNAPFGRFKNPNFKNEALLTACSRALQGAELLSRDFETTLAQAGELDFAYLDPPFPETFDGYTAERFDWSEHERLARAVRGIHQRKGRFLMSNAALPQVKRLYRGFKIETVVSRRRGSCKTSSRGECAELLIRNY